VLLDASPFALLDEDSLDAALDLGVERHFGEARLGVPDREEAGQFASRLGQRNELRFGRVFAS